MGSTPARATKQDKREEEDKEKEIGREGRRVIEIINNQETINTVRIAMFEQNSGELLGQLVGDKGRQPSKAKNANLQSRVLINK